MPWIFLALSLVGAAFTANALWPLRHRNVLVGSFLAAWLTGELAAWHLVWQAVATVILVALGGLEAWPGWLALAITLVSWIGLARIVAASSGASGIVAAALRDGLGADYDREIVGRRPRRLARATTARRLTLPFLLRSRKVRRIKDVRYAEGAGRRHLLDLWVAREAPDADAGLRPVLLQIHGGAWTVGSKNQQGLPLMLRLAAEGWICVAINYRLSPRATFPDHLVDCKRALAWIREHVAEHGGDPDAVVVTGGSAGGHLAALVALTAGDPRYQPGFESVDTSVRACVPFYAPTDLPDLFRFGRRRSTRLGDRVSTLLMGSTPDEDPRAWRDASPIARVHEDAPPFFVIHGTGDNLVPVAQARDFVAALRAASREPVCYAELPGAPHAFDVFYSLRADAAVEGVDRFLAWVESTRLGGDAASTPAPGSPLTPRRGRSAPSAPA